MRAALILAIVLSSPAAAGDAAQLRCRAGDLRACRRILAPLAYAAVVENACQRDATACPELARVYEGARGVRRDPRRADAALARACASGISKACRLSRSDEPPSPATPPTPDPALKAIWCGTPRL